MVTTNLEDTSPVAALVGPVGVLGLACAPLCDVNLLVPCLLLCFDFCGSILAFAKPCGRLCVQQLRVLAMPHPVAAVASAMSAHSPRLSCEKLLRQGSLPT